MVGGVEVVSLSDVGASAKRNPQFGLDELDCRGFVCALEGEHVESVHTLRGGDAEVHVGTTEVNHVEVNDIGRLPVNIKDFKVEEVIGHVVK